MLGYLNIYVGGYKYKSDHAFAVFTDGENQYAIPDRKVKAPVFEPGTPEWAEHGWAVGDNPRGRFCKWISSSGAKKRAFKSFDEAVRYVFDLHKRRKMPHEHYMLVYVWRQATGATQEQVVASEAEIAAIDTQFESDMQSLHIAKSAFKATHPDLDLLRKHYGPASAARLSALLKRVREQGEQAAFTDVSRSTAFRDLAKLRKAGLIA